eukprot:scaffold757_cov246-Pinguiococcus_pyrenoidosus.AAC.15
MPLEEVSVDFPSGEARKDGQLGHQGDGEAADFQRSADLISRSACRRFRLVPLRLVVLRAGRGADA